jgi:hypothetical protein
MHDSKRWLRQDVSGKTHSSLGGRKAYLNFELKNLRRPEAARLWRVLEFKVQMRFSAAMR